jgi:hypothetical protein
VNERIDWTKDPETVQRFRSGGRSQAVTRFVPSFRTPWWGAESVSREARVIHDDRRRP